MIDIDNLVAGSELDAIIAEKVMGWRGAGLKAAEVGVLWSPSTRMGDAWEVIEKISQGEIIVTVRSDRTALRWICIIETPRGSFSANEPTAPIAICRAALKAVLKA